MLSTQRSLATAQLGRNSFEEIFESRTPLREAALESFRRRNAVLDGIFYDIGKVTQEEARETAPWLAREGAILIVPPSGAGSLKLCNTVEDFANAGGADVRILAVAGVGSSALGAAAFARNVADRVVFMRDGYVVEEGPAREVIDTPKMEATQAFLSHFHKGAQQRTA